MNTAQGSDMPMPAEFCYPDDAQDDQEPYLAQLGAYVVDLQVAQYEQVQMAARALRRARAVEGTMLESVYRTEVDRHLMCAKQYGRKLAELQS